jgi:hypothetical protein
MLEFLIANIFSRQSAYLWVQLCLSSRRLVPLFVCLFVLFLLAIVFSVLRRYTDYDCSFGFFKLFLIKSWDLNIKLLTIALANICKLSGLGLKNILIQQELIFIEKDRTNIPKRTRTFILKEFKFEYWQRGQ